MCPRVLVETHCGQRNENMTKYLGWYVVCGDSPPCSSGESSQYANNLERHNKLISLQNSPAIERNENLYLAVVV